MRIAICDDNEEELRQIELLLMQYQSHRPSLRLSIHTFSGGEALLEELGRHPPFDLYLLDILMGGMTGIELANRLTEFQHAPVVVFLTSSTDFAVDAFRVRARHYLLKPIDREDLFTALDEFCGALTDRRKPVTISTAESSRVTLPISDIMYAECVIHTVHYHMADDAVFSSRSIRVPFAESIQALLDSGLFILIHRSFAVNLDHILRLTDNSVVLRGGAELPVSRLRLSECRTAYLDHLLDKRGAP